MTSFKNAHGELSDKELWERFLEGDIQVLEIIFNNHFKKLFRYGMTLFPDEAIVKDCIQVLFIELWSKKDQLSSIEQLQPYLYKSLRNRIYNQYKSKKRYDELIKDLKVERLIGINSEETNDVDTSNLQTLVNDLPMRQREAIMLIFFEGHTYESASDILSINIQSLYTLVSRAVGSLRSNLRKN